MPVVTVAAINGHAYAGGFLIALACDYRGAVQSSQRLDMCMNEAEMGVPNGDSVPPPLFPSMNALLQVGGGVVHTLERMRIITT